ncbi:MAG: cation-transporting P-type ATPase, partial [Eubacteriales bacterium]|nr:cation-transporting P-type ATPase [Eubacteriales bacterium]
MSEMYQRSTDEVLAEIGTSGNVLSGKEAAERLAKYGHNKLKEAPKITVFQRFLQQIKDPMLLILLAAAAVSAVTNAISGESFAEVFII